MGKKRLGCIVLLLSATLLGACKTHEERAAEYFLSAQGFIQEDDVDRALVELRNLIDIDNFNFEGRKLYADLLYGKGQYAEAYGQYLRLVEQYPDVLEVRVRLSEMALRTGNWDELDRHAKVAFRLDPQNAKSRALKTASDYRSAQLVQDAVAAAEASEEARQILAEGSANVAALFVLIDWLYNGPSPEDAPFYIDQLLDVAPDLYSVHITRVRILDELGLSQRVGAALRAAVAQFPTNTDISDMLIDWYLSRDDVAGAEAFLRKRAGPDDAASEGHFAVVRLLGVTRGNQAALAELARLEAANAGTDRALNYALRGAVLQRAMGDTLSARTTFERVVDETSQSDLRNQARAALARLALEQRDPDRAHALVAAILESDPSNVAALILRGGAALREGESADAVLALRRALDQDPRNPDVLLLLSEAQKAQGNVELAEQRLAQAIDVTRARPRETIAYARFQQKRGNLDAAQAALTASFEGYQDLSVAQMLGQILLENGDADAGAQLVGALTRIGAREATDLANSLKSALLFSQNRVDESIRLLQTTLGDGGEKSFRAALQMLRIQVQTERFADAEALLTQLKHAYPDNGALGVLEASVLAAQGRAPEAIGLLRSVLASDPGHVLAAQRLHGLLLAQGDADTARAELRAALAANPQARVLRILAALDLEREGNAEQAITLYSQLYDERPSDLVVVNNYANALALYRDDMASHEKALEVSRRLIGSKNPQYLDTLGLALLRAGDADEALPNLQAAARGLPDEPIVAFNLGLALAEMGRREDALRELRRGMMLAGAQDGLPQYDAAREALRRLGG